MDRHTDGECDNIKPHATCSGVIIPSCTVAVFFLFQFFYFPQRFTISGSTITIKKKLQTEKQKKSLDFVNALNSYLPNTLASLTITHSNQRQADTFMKY